MTDKLTDINGDENKIICSVDINSIKISAEHNTKTVLQNFQCKFERGLVYAILGKNGTGKTTLLNSISRILDEKSFNVEGRISINQDDIFTCNNQKMQLIRRNFVRYIFQDSQNLFDPLKKLSYYFQDVAATEKNTLAGLFDYFLLPKMDNILNSYPHELSTGMAQRVALIFGFISEAKLLLLDEPNSALDLPISNLLSKKLIEHSREKLTAEVFTTQDLNFAIKTADKIILINNSGYLEYDNSSADQQQLVATLKTILID